MCSGTSYPILFLQDAIKVEIFMKKNFKKDQQFICEEYYKIKKAPHKNLVYHHLFISLQILYNNINNILLF